MEIENNVLYMKKGDVDLSSASINIQKVHKQEGSRLRNKIFNCKHTLGTYTNKFQGKVIGIYEVDKDEDNVTP